MRSRSRAPRIAGYAAAALVAWFALAVTAALRVFLEEMGEPSPSLGEIPGGTAFAAAAARVMAAAFGVVLTFLAAAGAGHPVVAATVRRPRQGGLDGRLADLVSGIAVLGLALLGLGLAGLLRVVPVTVIAGTAAAFALWRGGCGRWPRFRPGPPLILPAILAAVAAAGMVLGALAPETEIDSLSYHLGKVGSFAGEGRVTLEAFHPSLLVQSLWEVLLVPAFMLGGESALRLANPAAVLVAGLFLWRGMCATGPGGGILAASLFVTAAPVVGLAAGLKNDLLTVILAFGAFRFALDSRRGTGTGRALLCGFLLGGALGVKLTVAPVAAAVLGLVAWPGAGRHGGGGRRLLAAAAGVALAFAPWALLAFEWRGNPLFPLAVGWFGGGLSEGTLALNRLEWYGYLRADYSGTSGVFRSLWNAAAVDGGFLFPLLALPALALAGRRGWPGVAWGACALAGSAFWLAGPPRARYLLPLAPVCCGVAEWLVASMPRRTWRPAALVILTVLVALETGRGWIGGRYDLPARSAVAAGLRDPAGYSLTRLGALAHAASWAGGHLPSRAVVAFAGEVRASSLRRRAVVRSMPERPFFLDAAEEAMGPAHLGRKLRQAGVTHLVYNRTAAVYRREHLALIRPSRRALALWSRWFRANARLVYEPPFADPRNGAFYVVELRRPPFRSGVILPGCEGWLWEPEHLLAEGKPAEAVAVFDGLVRDTGGAAFVRQARAMVLEPVLGPARTEGELLAVEAAGMRSVSLYAALARLAGARGKPGPAARWRNRAAMLEIPAWLAAHPGGI